MDLAFGASPPVLINRPVPDGQVAASAPSAQPPGAGSVQSQDHPAHIPLPYSHQAPSGLVQHVSLMPSASNHSFNRVAGTFFDPVLDALNGHHFTPAPYSPSESAGFGMVHQSDVSYDEYCRLPPMPDHGDDSNGSCSFSSDDDSKPLGQKSERQKRRKLPCKYPGCTYTGTNPTRHYKNVHEDERYACPVEGCDYQPKRKDNLHKHIAKQHRLYYEQEWHPSNTKYRFYGIDDL